VAYDLLMRHRAMHCGRKLRYALLVCLMRACLTDMFVRTSPYRFRSTGVCS
jgi:hypothetical protein